MPDIMAPRHGRESTTTRHAQACFVRLTNALQKRQRTIVAADRARGATGCRARRRIEWSAASTLLRNEGLLHAARDGRAPRRPRGAGQPGNRAAGVRPANWKSSNAFDGDWIAIDRPGFRSRDYSGLVIMGGPMNVDQTDRYPYLAAEVEWLRTAVADELPTLGVCLGAQLLAKAAGARVYRKRGQGNRLVRNRAAAAGRRRRVAVRRRSPARDRVPVARRHIRSARAAAVLLASGHVVPPPGDPLRPASIGARNFTWK